MKRRWLLAVLALPVPVTLLIPALLVAAFCRGQCVAPWARPSDPLFWLGAAAGLAGLALALWSAAAFARHGDGTPAPWDPPARFVVSGPYRFVRNPMILGVILVLLGEAALLRCPPLFVWFALFTLGNALYIPLVEEKGLERRFGASYRRYKQHVPRWMPRSVPWPPADERAPEKENG